MTSVSDSKDDERDELLAFRGTIVDSSEGSSLKIDPHQIVVVQNGKIIFRENAKEKEKEILAELDLDENDVHVIKPGGFLMPGMCDLHFHAPQFRNIGNHLDLELFDWLQKYTFPTESKFKATEFASEIYDKAVKRTLKSGTTTAVYFATIHLEASLLLAEIAEKYGQRAFIGKVNMDTDAPDYYRETTEESMRHTETFVAKLLDKKNPLVTPVVTPRFVLSCTPQLLTFLGETARKYRVPIQSHIAESKEEYQMVLQRFPGFQSYAQIYDSFNLLTDETVMAHGVHLTDEDVQLLAKTGAGIAHCPNSNISIRSGICDVQRLIKNGIKVGIGTDVSAGYSYSMLDASRCAVLSTKILSVLQNPYQQLSYQQVFRLSTLGGFQVLGMSDQLGTLEVGKQFDSLLVETDRTDASMDAFSDDTFEERIERFLFQGDDRNIRRVYVQGKRVV